jgi:hypothetical protein
MLGPADVGLAWDPGKYCSPPPIMNRTDISPVVVKLKVEFGKVEVNRFGTWIFIFVRQVNNIKLHSAYTIRTF